MNRTWLIGLTVAVVAGGIFLTTRRPPLAEWRGEGLATVGPVAAEEVSRLLNGAGDIVIIEPDLTRFGIPLATEPMRAFQETLAKNSRIKVRAVKRIRFPIGLPTGQVEEMVKFVRGQEGLAAVVIFGGLGGFPETPLEQLRPSTTKHVAILTYPLVKRLFDRGLLDLAIITKGATLPGETEPATAGSPVRAEFDRSFVVVTRETAPQLPDEPADG